MTKSSAILLAPVVDMHLMPDPMRDVVRNLFTHWLRGLGDGMHKRLLRWVGRLMNAVAGEGFVFYPEVERSLAFHNRWMAIEDRFFHNQDYFTNRKAFRLWLKTGAAFGDYYLGKDRFGADRMVFVPSSVQFEQCSDDEMREFTADAVEFLRGERAQRRLWRHLNSDDRAEMVERLLADPREAA